MNLLAYVHLRNIHGSTGAGRVARQLTEHLAQQPDTRVEILADPDDHQRVVPQVGGPWQSYRYHFVQAETSWQQARWILTGSPTAEHYWPDTQVMFCTAESYVPTRRARLAVTLHDAAYFEAGAHRADWAFYKQRCKWQLLYRTLERKADLFHTVSQFSADRLTHFFPSIRSRLRVVHNAVTQRFFEPVSAEGEQYVQGQGLLQQPYLLLPRGLAHRKNADLVLAAWPVLRQRHPDLRLVVTSHCDAPYDTKADALGPSVLRTGFVSDEALRSLYGHAQAVWFPSLYEGFGLPVLEAMACGAPVVASASSSLPEVSGNAAVLVSPTWQNEHIDALDMLLTDTTQHAEWQRRGRAWAQAFTWQRAAGELQHHFQALL